jgi:hypothetical protein
MTRAHEPGEGRGWIEFVGLFVIYGLILYGLTAYRQYFR